VIIGYTTDISPKCQHFQPTFLARVRQPHLLVELLLTLMCRAVIKM